MLIKMSGGGGTVALGGGGQNYSVQAGAEKGVKLEGRAPDANVLAEVAKYEERAAKGNPAAMFEDGKTGLQIAGISKTFVMNDGRLNEAVKRVCLGVENSTVFGLLGMNGAGKTTLLHTLQGKHQASEGDCFINGQTDKGKEPIPLSCRNDVDRVRQLFGICPQHEVIWEFVTPREHLRAFAHIRGVNPEKIEPMVEALLRRMNLLEKADEPAGTLSGGMKRRLSIAMAVIGSPRVVFLDEPTTGLDPNTRRFVWDYILEIKENRIIVLTTHSMEEADALCTRIGIMVNGELKSLGTPQELKHMYGGGYRVIVRLQEDSAEDGPGELLQVLEKEYNGEDDKEDGEVGLAGEGKDNGDAASSAETSGPTAVSFVATNSSDTLKIFNVQRDDIKLGRLFELLESKREEFGIMDYSVSQTTMDEVFRKFAKFQVEEQAHK
jgi:ATP-binding cassette subfamily A (ABC1) protein 3